MSRPESPEPCYDHPECAPKRGGAIRGVRTHVPVEGTCAGAGPCGPIGADRTILAVSREPQQAVAEELQAFLGWVLELLILAPENTGQLRTQLRRWQYSLRLSTAGCRLSWTEAFVLYGLRLRKCAIFVARTTG